MSLPSRLTAMAFGLATLLLTSPAFAKAGGSDLEKVGGEVTQYLIWVLGPIVFLVGLVMAMYSLFFGDDRGTRRGINTVVAGVLLFAAPSIVEFIKNAVR